MNVTVTKEGLIVPTKLLKGIKQANVKWEKNKIIILPIKIDSDPIFSLGTHPGHSDQKDASVHHDKYLKEHLGPLFLFMLYAACTCDRNENIA